MLQKLNKALCGCVQDREPEFSDVNGGTTTRQPYPIPNGRAKSVNMDPSAGFHRTPIDLNSTSPVTGCGAQYLSVNGRIPAGVSPVNGNQKTPTEEQELFNNNHHHHHDRRHQHQELINQRRRKSSSTGSRSPTEPIMGYSSANLDDPDPCWSAYDPQNGVAWAPRRTHTPKDPDSASFRKFRSMGSIQSLRSVRGRVMSRSANSLNSVSSFWNKTINPASASGGKTCEANQSGSHAKRRRRIRSVNKSMNDSIDGTVVIPNGHAPASPTSTASRRRCYTEGSDRTPRIRARSRARSRAMSRESVQTSKLDKSWASFDEYNWDTSVLVLDDPDEVFLDDDDDDDDEEDEEDVEGEGVSFTADESRDTLDQLDSTSGLDSSYYYYTEDNGEGSVLEENSKLKRYLGAHDLGYLLIPRRNLRTGRLIMRGDNFCVCCGCLVTAQHQYSAYMRPVSVQIYKGVNSDDDQVNFLKNVKQMRKLRHSNILEVLGVCIEGSPMTRDGVEMLLVTEKSHYQVGLQRLLRWASDNNRELLSRRCASQFAIEICRGLQYLKEKRVLHTNLTSATVVLDGECHAKLSRIETHPISTRTADYEWMAIESLREGAYTNKSTVWSFGVILWEIVSVGIQPYATLKNCQQVFIYLSTGRRLPRPSGGSYRLYNMMYQCWNPYPRQRPTFKQLISALTKYQQTLPASRPARQLFPDREDFWQVLRDFL